MCDIKTRVLKNGLILYFLQIVYNIGNATFCFKRFLKNLLRCLKALCKLITTFLDMMFYFFLSYKVV